MSRTKIYWQERWRIVHCQRHGFVAHEFQHEIILLRLLAHDIGGVVIARGQFVVVLFQIVHSKEILVIFIFLDTYTERLYDENSHIRDVADDNDDVRVLES